jgi:hypothetical protein
MAIATKGGFHITEDWQTPLVYEARVVTSTGFGDGYYPVVYLDEAGTGALGIEIVFMIPEAEEVAKQSCLDAGLVEPGDQDYALIYGKNETGEEFVGEEASQARVKIDTWNALFENIHQTQYEELLKSSHPGKGTYGQGLHILNHKGGDLAIGDPCYGSGTAQVSVPAGNYVIIQWISDQGGMWGERVARLGAYKLPN